MSELEKLLEGVEVEWKTLNLLISTVTAPAKLKKSSYGTDGNFPVIDQGVHFIS